MAKGGEIQVHAGDQQFVGGGHVQRAAARCAGFVAIGIEGQPGFRQGELDAGQMDHIAPDQQGAGARSEQPAGMARRVTRQMVTGDAGDPFLAMADGAGARGIGAQRPLRGGKVALGGIGCCDGLGVIEPEGGFQAVDDDLGVGEIRRAIAIDEATDMVDMGVGDQDSGDVRWREAQRDQPITALAHVRAEGGATTGIDQHFLASDIEQEGRDGDARR